MPEEKGLGSKLLGLFVESKEGPSPDSGPSDQDEKSAADQIADIASRAVPPKMEVPPALGRMAPPLAGTGAPVTPAQVDFDAVFKTAGMDVSDLDRVRKAEELLKSLPEATPLDIKRQIVEASLKAFGFDIAKIVGSATGQLKALETYVRINEQQTAKGITDAQAQIAQLEDKVISLRADINKRTDQLAAVAAAADARKGQIHRVLEFFNASAAVAPKP
jgi:hypothetical protein